VIGNLPFLLTDTVGFIRKLPTQLVESFKSTLDEVREADLLIHVVDISHESFEDHIESVNHILMEINAHQKPMIMVFNKIDDFSYEKKTKTILPSTRKNVSLEEWKKPDGQIQISNGFHFCTDEGKLPGNEKNDL
jgi:GTP-binding protein HflX